MSRLLFLVLVLLGLQSIAVAMVPRERRGIYDKEYPNTTEETNTKGTIICASYTVCGFTVSEEFTGRIQDSWHNQYCVCDSQSECQKKRRISNTGTEYYCRPITDDTTTEITN